VDIISHDQESKKPTKRTYPPEDRRVFLSEDILNTRIGLIYNLLQRLE